MRKMTTITLITIAFAYVLMGCTMMPASQETGVGPEEYAEIRNTENLKHENEVLKDELNNTKAEMKEIEKNYLELAKNNDSVHSKLEEAEAKLDILENEGVPRFKSEKTDKNSIMAYLGYNKDVLEKRLKGIEIVDSIDESKVLFYTIGYGDSLNQLFIWNEGDSEPILINGADFEKSGELDWINDKFLEINTDAGEYKIIDTDSIDVISNFYSKKEAHLIPGTSTYILQKQDTGIFAVYDFINTKEQEINLDYKNKYTAFNISNDNIAFTGTYTDEYETQYTVEAVMSFDKLKEKYNIISMEEAIETKENNSESKDETEIIESTDEGTV